ncbi:MAG: ribosomal protein methyltransferase [Pseudomonadota bacterium]|jgi:ribosomal protein L11 methyltransferase
MAWLQITFSVETENAECFAALLFEHGALSVTMLDGSDQPIYEPPLNSTPLWQDTRLQTLFENEINVDSLLDELQIAWGKQLPFYDIEELEDQDWVQKGIADFHAMPFGKRLWVCPSWENEINQADAVIIQLDPGLAFGTGAHPTTALCLKWLDAHDLMGKTVLDVGCGTGILAIAAMKLGANNAWGIDIDPQALDASKENAQNNHVFIDWYLPEKLPPIQVDIVLANILANPLCELAPRLMNWTKPQGLLVLSGILRDQADQICNAYQPFGDILEIAQQDDWLRIVVQKF